MTSTTPTSTASFYQLPDRTRARQHEYSIRDFFIKIASGENRFSHFLTINAARDFGFEQASRSTVTEFLSRFMLFAEIAETDRSPKFLRKRPVSEKPKLFAVAEDLTRYRTRTARHLHCLIEFPKLSDPHVYEKARLRAIEISNEIFKCSLTNFHVEPLPSDRQSRREAAGYSLKNAVVPDSPMSEPDILKRVWTEADYLRERSSSTRRS